MHHKIQFAELNINDLFIYSGLTLKKIDNFNAVTVTDRGKQHFQFNKSNLVSVEKKTQKDKPPFNLNLPYLIPLHLSKSIQHHTDQFMKSIDPGMMIAIHDQCYLIDCIDREYKEIHCSDSSGRELIFSPESIDAICP